MLHQVGKRMFSLHRLYIMSVGSLLLGNSVLSGVCTLPDGMFHTPLTMEIMQELLPKCPLSLITVQIFYSLIVGLVLHPSAYSCHPNP